tara:strand:+ start:1255 stop:1734 length:480 start_codon:yes stop_codon:yes gene_type:complete
MAGILPITYYKNKVYFLFGRETKDVNNKQAGQWSDFGGTREKGETLFQTAVREGYEETDGIFGDEQAIGRLIEDYQIEVMNQGKYKIYMVMVPYKKELPKKFRLQYKKAKKENIKLITEHNGLYEKDMIRWFTIDSLKKNINEFRPWYRAVIRKLIKRF